MIFSQIFDMVNIGLVVLEPDLNVYKWNRWMELHSGITSDQIIGKPLFEFYPNLNTASFLRNSKSVQKFGNFAFFSQKLHKYSFPLKPDSSFESEFEFMQQSCTMGPLRDENKVITHLYISVQDVTDIVAYEHKLYEMTIKDPLTKAYNRRFLETKLKDEFQRFQRYKRTFCLVMIDIDFFKKVNDTYGHQCGDYVLKVVSKIIIDMIRTVDTFSRYGGEEFCCLLLETDLEMGSMVAERFREKIMNYDYEYEGQKLNITVSQGITESTNKVSNGEALLKKADDALYEAKETGRNKVISDA